MFKFELNQLVYHLKDNKVHSAPILSRHYVDNKVEVDWSIEKKDPYSPFGKARVEYYTCHGTFEEEVVFKNKEELKNSL